MTSIRSCSRRMLLNDKHDIIRLVEMFCGPLILEKTHFDAAEGEITSREKRLY